ncbi:nuclease-related domain-containing protein [Polaribacter sp. Hel_I_88]|uniref:nuclease-related domain-containing protein n=1 Tax=Polaribacter sp. Hel_I_88 TaxID=1250006 RepID=UPI000479A417|nr:nuclease-related domain-containing protein [Polaribacter sp. Hel_I_88]
MAIIIGTIESLKSLKFELKRRKISRFKSVKEINEFLLNYNSEKLEIFNNVSKKLKVDFIETSINLKSKIYEKNEQIKIETEKINNQIIFLQQKINLIEKDKNQNFIIAFTSSLKVYFIKNRLNYFINNKSELIKNSIIKISKKITNDELFINEYKKNRKGLIERIAKPKIEKLENTRTIVKNLKNLISGAIGENLVTKEIAKLSDDFVLINDFNLKFPKPIYYKKKNERIHSIQIDHLLISKAGIFIIETKNWNNFSINSTNLKSPVEQIERFNFALFIYISENITLKNHHWGEKRIPIRNVIVMINEKPSIKFKFVKVKLLGELNDYINYFEPIFTSSELKIITKKLTAKY